MRILVLCASVILSLTITPAGFTQDRIALDPCANVEQGLELSNCIAGEYQRADAELNTVYRQVMSKLDNEEHKTALRNAQRAWIEYRDTNCEYETYLFRQGGPSEQHRVVCTTRMSMERTRELQEMLKDN
jgi:uncharacterized protein YecT (DUF1311 family)